MKALRSRDASDWLRAGVFVLFALLPVSMPAHLFVNHLLGRTWCWYSAFLYPESILVVLLLGLVWTSPTARRRVRVRFSSAENGGRDPLMWFLSLGVLIVGWTALTALFQASHTDFWVQRVLAGWIFPMAMIVALLGVDGTEGLDAAWRGLAAGSTLLLLAALFLYVMSFGVPRAFRELVFDNRTSKAHLGLRGGIYFGELTLGGFNDIAVFFATGIAVAWGALVASRTAKARRIVAIWLAAALTLEFLCYSRGAILSIGGGALVFFAVGARRRVATNLVPPLVFAAFLACVLLPAGAVDYWTKQLKVQSGTSAEFRVSLWKGALQADPSGHRFQQEGPPAVAERMDRAVLESRKSVTPGPAAFAGPAPAPVPVALNTVRDDSSALRRQVAERSGPLPRRLLLGYGPGNFGVIQGMTYDAGTHNLFLDALVSSGVLGLALVGSLWTYLLVVSGLAAARAPFAAVEGKVLYVTAQSLLATIVTLLLCAVLVNVRVDNLGTSLFGAVLWLLIATACEASRPRASSGEGSGA